MSDAPDHAPKDRGAALSALSDIACAVQFLSRLPVYRTPGLPRSVRDALRTSPDFTRMAALFPIAGILIALPAAAILLISVWMGAPPVVASLLSVMALIVTTGALHEDGLADVTDGFWGGHTRERKLAIMRDSAIGTYGTLALILTVALRVACLSLLLERGPETWAAAALVAIAGLSRAAMLYPWFELPAARPSHGNSPAERQKEASGLSARYGMPDKRTLRAALLWSAAPIVLLLVISSISATLFTLFALACAMYAMTSIMRTHVGGHTGDTLGATQQTAELGCLLALVLTM